jgi:signal peptidase I
LARDRRQVAAIVLTALVVLSVAACWRGFPRFINKSGGMEPTLHIGDYMVFRRVKNVGRGDVIAFRYPLQPDTIFVKRVVAASGDTVEIRNKRLLLNGKTIEENHIQHDDPQIYPKRKDLPEPYRSRDQFGPVKIPAGEYFVLGDNRDKSSDSRYWGNLPQQYVIGKLAFVISPTKGLWRP